MSEVPVPSRSAQWWSRFPAADDALHARAAALSARIGVIATQVRAVDVVTRELIERYGLSVRLDVAAGIAGFSDDKVRELRRAGRFPGHRAGTKVMVFVPELVEWIRNGGEAQYEPPRVQPGRRRDRELRPSRKADHPAWMDRVGAPTSPDP